MIVAIMFLFIMFGMLMALMTGYISMYIPVMLQMILAGFSFMLPIVGIFMLVIRAKRTGAEHLLDVARPDKMIWFYIKKNGTVKIIPAAEVKNAEGMVECKQLNLTLQDKKSYRLFDHQVRFVPEGIGHTADVRHCLYAKVMKRKHLFEGLKDGRKKIFKDQTKYQPKAKPKVSEEDMEYYKRSGA